jgi:hypothetical protein
MATYLATRFPGDQLLTLAQSLPDPMGLLAAANGLGTTLTHLGDFLPARAYEVFVKRCRLKRGVSLLHRKR